MAKIIPIFKKGDNTKIENYRPIANLCSSSKIFEKLILKQINYLESTNKLDLTGKQQHGFKKNKSTATASTFISEIMSVKGHELKVEWDKQAPSWVFSIILRFVKMKGPNKHIEIEIEKNTC